MRDLNFKQNWATCLCEWLRSGFVKRRTEAINMHRHIDIGDRKFPVYIFSHFKIDFRQTFS